MSAHLDAELARFEAARLRWMTGGDADADGDALCAGVTGPEAQLRLLAQAAQIRQVCLHPEPPEILTNSTAFPTPALPLLAETLRPLFRRLMAQAQGHAGAQQIVGLMARRGVMAHPFDWLPPKDSDGFPPEYAALSAWVAGNDTQTPPTAALSDDTWDNYLPAERRAAFEALRSDDPDTARALLEARVKTVPAEERVRLVEALAVGLGDADQAFVEDLQTDRSGKVKTAARRLLARLGALAADEDAQELADFLDQQKAMLTRKTTIAPRKKLNPTQQNRMAELIQTVAVGQLAEVLAIDEATLAASWGMKDAHVAGLMLLSFARTGSDAGLRGFWRRMKAEKIARSSDLLELLPRLTRAEVETEVLDLIRAGQLDSLVVLQLLLGPELPEHLAKALLASPEVTETLAAARAAAKTPDPADHKERLALGNAQDLLGQLGTLLPRAQAMKLHEQVTGTIFHSADPALDPLNFNISLEGSQP